MKGFRLERHGYRDYSSGHSGFVRAAGSIASSLLRVKQSLKMPDLDLFLRAVRVTVGSLILLTIVVTILIPQVLPVSGNSFVNARLEWIRTPIQGDIAFKEFKVGDKISRGTVVGTVQNMRADDFFLNQLQSEKSSLESALFTLENRREHLTDYRDQLKVGVADSLADLEQKTRIRLQIIDNEMSLAEEEKAAVIARLSRYRQANKKYTGTDSYAVVSRAAIDELVDREMELATSIASQKNTITLLQTKLESALAGTFVSEDTPLEQQQMIETDRALASIHSEIDSLTLKSGKLTSQIQARLAHLKMNTRYEMVTNVSGTLWDIGFPNGSFVNEGDSVVAIADINTIRVEGNFHQRYLDNIKVGDPATINLMGSSKKLKGTVTEVKIRDQIKSADLSAFNLESPASDEFKVVVSVNEQHRQDIYIGQRAKLIISKSSSSFIPSLLLLFNR